MPQLLTPASSFGQGREMGPPLSSGTMTPVGSAPISTAPPGMLMALPPVAMPYPPGGGVARPLTLQPSYGGACAAQPATMCYPQQQVTLPPPQGLFPPAPLHVSAISTPTPTPFEALDIQSHLAAKDKQLEDLSRRAATLQENLKEEQARINAEAGLETKFEFKYAREQMSSASSETGKLCMDISKAAEVISQLNSWFLENADKMRTQDGSMTPSAYLHTVIMEMKEKMDSVSSKWSQVQTAFETELSEYIRETEPVPQETSAILVPDSSQQVSKDTVSPPTLTPPSVHGECATEVDEIPCSNLSLGSTVSSQAMHTKESSRQATLPPSAPVAPAEGSIVLSSAPSLAKYAANLHSQQHEQTRSLPQSEPLLHPQETWGFTEGTKTPGYVQSMPGVIAPPVDAEATSANLQLPTTSQVDSGVSSAAVLGLAPATSRQPEAEIDLSPVSERDTTPRGLPAKYTSFYIQSSPRENENG